MSRPKGIRTPDSWLPAKPAQAGCYPARFARQDRAGLAVSFAERQLRVQEFDDAARARGEAVLESLGAAVI
jgi:hypothetical protein